MLPEPAYWSLAAVLAVALSARGYRRGSLNASGAAFALPVGFVSCGASLTFGLTLITFFLSASKMTRVGAERKRRLEDGHQVGGNRNWAQVAANAGSATLLAAVFWYETRRLGVSPELAVRFGSAELERLAWLQAAYLCHYACCNADTWASELGVLSASAPVLVTAPWRSVPPGTNGGATAAGTLASLGGGTLIGVVFWGVGVAMRTLEAALSPAAVAAAPAAGPPPTQWPIVPLAAAAGVVGSLIDSVLGATLQYSGFSDGRRVVVNSPAAASRRICGRDVLDNHQVNALAAAATSALGALFASQWLFSSV